MKPLDLAVIRTSVAVGGGIGVLFTPAGVGVVGEPRSPEIEAGRPRWASERTSESSLWMPSPRKGGSVVRMLRWYNLRVRRRRKTPSLIRRRPAVTSVVRATVNAGLDRDTENNSRIAESLAALCQNIGTPKHLQSAYRDWLLAWQRRNPVPPAPFDARQRLSSITWVSCR